MSYYIKLRLVTKTASVTYCFVLSVALRNGFGVINIVFDTCLDAGSHRDEFLVCNFVADW